nr:MAG TPA: hypothetical protein [Caudoviricetes sp.]
MRFWKTKEFNSLNKASFSSSSFLLLYIIVFFDFIVKYIP